MKIKSEGSRTLCPRGGSLVAPTQDICTTCLERHGHEARLEEI